MAINSIRIFPTIGIARLGNSPDQWYIGPEQPGQVINPAGGFKDDQCRIKRQAARFRLAAYDEQDNFVRFLTDDDGQITWSVHLANSKAAHISGDNTRKIDPGARQVTGPGQVAHFNTGRFGYGSFAPIDVPLGEIRTDSDAQLLVLGGSGASNTPDPARRNHISGLYDDAWTDDIADGPVSATVQLAGQNQSLTALGAWVIVGPPRYAPEIPNVINLYDRLYQYQHDHIGAQQFPIPQTPSFTNAIFPILQSAVMSNWVSGIPTDKHADLKPGSPLFAKLASTAASDKPVRERIYYRLKNTNPPSGFGPADMPLQTMAELTAIQLKIMEKWKDGNFLADWSGMPTSATNTFTPDGLTKAALEACVGGSFNPGIEAGRSVLQPIWLNNEPFRIDHNRAGPGDITKVMSCPWQSDFNACGGCWWNGQSIWWPAQRPIRAQVWDETQNAYTYQIWTRGVSGPVSMVENWDNLGFIVRQGDQFVETERCDTNSITLLTPRIHFDKIPSGPGGSGRTVQLAIEFEVVYPNSALDFIVTQPPGHHRITVAQGPYTIAATSPGQSDRLLIPISYQTGPQGEHLFHTLTVENVETARSWVIEIEASTIAHKQMMLALALDRSGSMSQPGPHGQSKIAALRQAVGVLIDHMEDGDHLALIGYNQNAQVLQGLTMLGPATASDPGRLQSRANINGPNLNPSGLTSIGDGIASAHNELHAVGGGDIKAMIVVSDGKENSPQMIQDVSAQINHHTYAIGIGQPGNISVAALQSITGNNGGYLLLTGNSSSTQQQFRLDKYFLQILSDVKNRAILIDPEGELSPRQHAKVPFTICDVDQQVDVTLLSPHPQGLAFSLITPDGRRISPEAAADHPDITIIKGPRTTIFRLSFPLTIDDRVSYQGEWTAVLENTAQGRPIPYAIIAHGHSDILFDAEVSSICQSSGKVQVRAMVTEAAAAHTQSRAWIELSPPRGPMCRTDMDRDDHGYHSAELSTCGDGAYTLRVRVRGQTALGADFHREKTLQVFRGVRQEDIADTAWEQEISDALEAAHDHTVYGRISSRDGKGLAKLQIQAFDLDYDGTQELGSSVQSDDEGRYLIRYQRSDYIDGDECDERSDVFLRITDSSGTLIHETPVRMSAPQNALINVCIDYREDA